MIISFGKGMSTPSPSANPFMNGEVEFSGAWQVGFELYDGIMYAEAVITEDGRLTVHEDFKADIWMIGGGGGTGRGKTYGDSTYCVGGGGSGYTEMLLGHNLARDVYTVTIGKGGASASEGGWNTGSVEELKTTNGGETSFGNVLSAKGGNRGVMGHTDSGRGIYFSNGTGGNDGGVVDNVHGVTSNAGENGTPGEGFIMSKFRSVEHNTDYGRADVENGIAGGWGVGNWGAPSTRGAIVIRIPLE